ncbi:hypothetical protein [Catenulispora pinisilvae]|nr:hypothetical protein [Catenulispora pinisilvae]
MRHEHGTRISDTNVEGISFESEDDTAVGNLFNPDRCKQGTT